MARLGENWWGKSKVRISKVDRNGASDDFSDLTVQVLLGNDGSLACVEGDNREVLPTDTMRNTVYVLAQDHLTTDLEDFAARLAGHFTGRPDVDRARVRIASNRWSRAGDTGFVGGGGEKRLAGVEAGPDGVVTGAGLRGLVLLKTRGSAFAGFPQDRYTTLPEAEDRLLATEVSARWRYQAVPGDTTLAWESARRAMMDSFFAEDSASLQHQGWMMGSAALAAVGEISEIELRLPNQHHLTFDLSRFGLEDAGVVFHPVTEPHGDIRLVVAR